jgi:hypothetical protein
VKEDGGKSTDSIVDDAELSRYVSTYVCSLHVT